MSNVKRYDLELVGPPFYSDYQLVEQKGADIDDAEWVRAEDYDALKTRAEVAETDLTWMKSSRGDVICELFEALGQIFYAETGMLRPGKDWPAAGGPRPANLQHVFAEWMRAEGWSDTGCQIPECEFCAMGDDDE